MFNKTKKCSQAGFVGVFFVFLFWGLVVFMIYFVGIQFANKKRNGQTKNIETQSLYEKDKEQGLSCDDKKTICVCNCK